MTELDGIFPDLALELIDEYGKVVQYVIVGAGVYDVATARNVAAWTPFDVKAIVEDYAPTKANNLIETADKKLTIAALAFNGMEPTQSDKFGVNGDVYTVVGKPVEVYSGELIATYEIQGRR